MTSKATVKVNKPFTRENHHPRHRVPQKSRRPGVDSHFESIDILLGT